MGKCKWPFQQWAGAERRLIAGHEHIYERREL
jgi:hypothetical protein